MAVNNKIREELPDGCVVFDNHSYDNSIIGVSHDGCVIYDFNKMVSEFSKDEGVSDLEAIEWIEYNTIRSLPYLSGNTPIIMYGLEDCYD